MVDKKDKAIQQYKKLLKLTKIEYQKIFEEKNSKKNRNNRKNNKEKVHKKDIKKYYKIEYVGETDSEHKPEPTEEFEEVIEEEGEEAEPPTIKAKRKVVKKIKCQAKKIEEPKKKKTRKIFEYLNEG